MVHFSLYPGKAIWDKVFKSGPSKMSGRQPSKNLKGIWSSLSGHVISPFYRNFQILFVKLLSLKYFATLLIAFLFMAAFLETTFKFFQETIYNLFDI